MLMRDLSSRSNVMIGSPLNVISYPGTTGEETLRFYYQSESGNIKETYRTGMDWKNAT